MAEHNWHEVAYRTWNILTEQATAKETLYYSQLGDLLGLHELLMRYPLDLIQTHCLREHLPPLNVLVVSKETGEPGAGFTAASPETLQQVRKAVLTFPWKSLSNPFEYASDGTSESELINQVLEGPKQGIDAYRRAGDRPFQGVFRKALLEAYGGHCAFSGAALEEALEAAHIVPWSQASDAERADVRNGLLLTAYHHRLFDRGLLQIDEDYAIHVTATIDVASLSDFDRQALGVLEGRKLRTPKNQRHYPDPMFIRRRNRDLAA